MIVDICVRETDCLVISFLFQGGSVADFLSEHGCMMERTALPILHQVLDGLSFMHTNHIVHGDIKGTNLILR